MNSTEGPSRKEGPLQIYEVQKSDYVHSEKNRRNFRVQRMGVKYGQKHGGDQKTNLSLNLATCF